MPEKEIHNVWTIYGREADGQEAVQPIAEFHRPQDWGDPRWVYHHFTFGWLTAPDGEPIICHCHAWTDLKREPHEYPQLFAPFICQVLLPGLDEELCGNEFMAEDDFWYTGWGRMPETFDPYDDEDYAYYGPEEPELPLEEWENLDTWDEEEEPDLGTCCVCEGAADVRNVIMLGKECPMPGRGWGCFICGLPMNGALAVVCDGCMEAGRELRWACRGYPATDGRIPIGDLQGEFLHDPARHHDGWDTGSHYDIGNVATYSDD